MGTIPRPRIVSPTTHLEAEDLPEQVTIAVRELAGAVKEGLLALSVGVGLAVVHELFEAEVTRPAGPKGKHDRERRAYRHGQESRQVTLGGRRVQAMNTAVNEQSSPTSDPGDASAQTAAAPKGARRRLSDEQELEVTRLYTATNTSVPEIARRVGIGEETIYRVLERHGAALRGRISPTKKQTAARSESRSAAGTGVRRSGNGSTNTERRGGAKPTAARKPASARTSEETVARGVAAVRKKLEDSSPSTRAAVATGRGHGQRSRVRFQAEVVLEAEDIRDALRQAEARGAVDVIAVSREA